MVKPSLKAVSIAKKRAKARDKAGAPINVMDVLKVLDILSKRLEKIEKEVYGKRDY